MARLKETIRELLPRQARVHRIKSGILRGARIVTSWHDYPGAILGTTEKPLLEWFARNVQSGETWLDVGAHYGYTAIALSRLTGGTGRVFAFEPVLSSASCITRTRELNGLRHMTVMPLGLDRYSGLRTCELPTIRGMADSTIEAGKWSERVVTASLDSLWLGICCDDPEIHGIKIDVQGMELGVLLGMRQLLLQWTPKLVIEFHRGVDRQQILEVLRACGYGTDWQPVSGNMNGPRDVFADDMSYGFVCASLSTPSSISQS